MLGFSPLRYWGGLYPMAAGALKISGSFSPLRYWGGLYPMDILSIVKLVVLVPFDIGVVYIKINSVVGKGEKF